MAIENQTPLLKNSNPPTMATASNQNTMIATSGAAPNAPNHSHIVPAATSTAGAMSMLVGDANQPVAHLQTQLMSVAMAMFEPRWWGRVVIGGR